MGNRVEHLEDDMGKWRRNKSLTRRWQRNSLINKYGAVCAICALAFKSMREITFDHKLPISKGGTDETENLQLAHAHCNQEKGNMTEEEFGVFQKGGEKVE